MESSVFKTRTLQKPIMLGALMLMLLVRDAATACNRQDYETVLGGYPEVHDVTLVNFDIDPKSLDMVVCGRVLINDNTSEAVQSSIIYYISEEFCRVEWVFFVTSFHYGVHYIQFDPLTPDRIYGIGESYTGYELFWIENSNPQTTNAFYQVSTSDNLQLRQLKGG